MSKWIGPVRSVLKSVCTVFPFLLLTRGSPKPGISEEFAAVVAFAQYFVSTVPNTCDSAAQILLLGLVVISKKRYCINLEFCWLDR